MKAIEKTSQTVPRESELQVHTTATEQEIKILKQLAMEAIQKESEAAHQESERQVNSTAAEQRTNVIAKTRSKYKQLKINKALIPLKLVLFFWHGSCSILHTFVPIYFTQLGISVYQLSIINIAALPFKFLGPIVAGIIADKTGRSKLVLYTSITFLCILVNAMLLIPKVEYKKCEEFAVQINCSTLSNNTNITSNFNKTTFPIIANLDKKLCDVQCPLESLSKSTPRSKNIPTSSGTTWVSSRVEQQFRCCIYGNISNNSSVEYNNVFIIRRLKFSMCENDLPCNFKCFNVNDDDCDVNEASNMMHVFVLSFLILVLYHCVLSSCYRFMDVLCMSMVKKYDSDFGRQMLWGVLSFVILSPLCGYLIKLTEGAGVSENYASAIYFVDGTALITILSIIKLDVEVNPPGKKLWKKALSLIKNSDVLMFYLLLLILGTSWCFRRIYFSLYLHGLNAPSLLIGVLPGESALAALPFLATSNWWVKKIGSRNLLLLALVGYSVHSTGYSFLVNPWYALIYEPLGIFTMHLAWVAVVRHSHKIAPEGLVATIIASAGGLVFGIGMETGSAVGLIMGSYGGKIAFRFVASMCGVTTIVFLFHRYLRR